MDAIQQKNKYRVGVLTFEQFRGQRNLGSSRIRGKWVADKWPDAELFVQGRKYDVVIYQKAYMVEHAKAFDGIKILDVCDPDFLVWGYRVREMCDEVHAVTCSTDALASQMRRFTDKPVYTVGDRLNLDEFTETKTHKGRAKTVAWYGYSNNFEMLRPAVPILKKHKLDLIVISDSGFNPGSAYREDFRCSNYPFNWETVNRDLLDADIVLNPQSTKGRFKYKSNNKTIMAWALGLPVAHDVTELEALLDETARIAESTKRLEEVKKLWDVNLSVAEYQDVIKNCT